MSGMDDLVTFLRAHLHEDERVARAAGSPYPHWITDPDGDVNMAGTGGNGYLATGPYGGSLGEAGEHMARWDPASVLAEVEAKRRILDDRDELAEWAAHDNEPSIHHMAGKLDDVVRMLALPYAEREGYQEEWRPA